MSDGDDEYEVGYGKPPKHSQFKKGQSGCRDGGRSRRDRRYEAKDRKRREHPANKFDAWVRERVTVRQKDGSKVKVSRFELFLKQLEEDVYVKRDADARKLFKDILQKNGWFEAPPVPPEGGGVLVVYPIPTPEQWVIDTEGKLLSEDPLEGTPYEGGKLLPKDRKKGPPDDPLIG